MHYFFFWRPLFLMETLESFQPALEIPPWARLS